MSSIRILIADDYERWRRQAHLLFQTRPEWQVIAEASDGSEAVQKAEELKPDLILLDIGLPKLNGIEAARRIRQLSPSPIVFLSQNNDRDIVRAALSTGALGYVLKTDAASELLPAIEAALCGKRFISTGLKAPHDLADTSGAKASCCHEVHFYSDDTALLDRLVPFIGIALRRGDAAVVAATASHLHQLAQRLRAEGLDVDEATKEGRYVPLDAADTIPQFMVNDMPDRARFFQVLGSIVEAAAKTAKTEQPRVAIFGEGVSLLLAEGRVDAVIRQEQLATQFAITYEVDILCGYALNSFHGKEDEHVFQNICSQHSAVHSQ